MNSKNDPSQDLSINMMFNQIMHLHFLKGYKYLKELNVHPGQVPLLIMLKNNKRLSQKDLVKLLNVKAPTVTMMIKRLEKQGVVEKEQCENDARVSYIFATEKGNELINKIELIVTNIENEAFKNMTDEEKMLLRRLFMQIKENLE